MEKASLASQLKGDICNIDDTEEMFWLRQSDDYQSKFKLGMLLCGQYRYEEAISAFLQAEGIKNDDPTLYLRMGGAYLTLFRFEESKKAYEKAISLGADKKSVNFPLGIWYYLEGDFSCSAETLRTCLPCDDELKIAVIYWEMLSCLKAGTSTMLADEFSSDMKVFHHKAYMDAVKVMLKLETPEKAIEELSGEDDLSYAIKAYGVAEYLLLNGDTKGEKLMETVLSKESMWPSIAYLAAYNHIQNKKEQ